MGPTDGGIREAIGIKPFALGSAAGSRSRSDLEPLPADHGTKSRPGFVFRPDSDLFSRMVALQFRNMFAEFFLKASRSSSVAPRPCRGRGICSDHPGRTRQFQPAAAPTGRPSRSEIRRATFGPLQSPWSGGASSRAFPSRRRSSSSRRGSLPFSLRPSFNPFSGSSLQRRAGFRIQSAEQLRYPPCPDMNSSCRDGRGVGWLAGDSVPPDCGT